MKGFEHAVKYLSPRIRTAVQALSVHGIWENVCEIRLRRGLALSFSTYNGCVFVSSEGRVCKISSAMRCNNEDIRYTLNCLCAGSVYRYADSLKKGYIVTPEGLRAGICGEAVYENGVLSVVDNYTAINIRIPSRYPACVHTVMHHIERHGLCSTLIYSPPGVGKTTLIRELAIRLSQSLRTAVVDEKGEILPAGMCDECGMCDILRGYSKPEGMEIAVRMMSPQVIICDEIGMADDIPAILSVQNSGVPLVATAHSSDMPSLMAKPNIKRLCDSGVFHSFILLEKGDNGMKTVFENGN